MVLKIFLKTVEFYILQAKKFFKAGFFIFVRRMSAAS